MIVGRKRRDSVAMSDSASRGCSWIAAERSFASSASSSTSVTAITSARARLRVHEAHLAEVCGRLEVVERELLASPETSETFTRPETSRYMHPPRSFWVTMNAPFGHCR